MNFTDADALTVLDNLPNLMQLAKERGLSGLHRVQIELRDQYRAAGVAFVYSVPVRAMDRCPQCGVSEERTQYWVEYPALNLEARTTSLQLHAVREHGLPMEGRLKSVLQEVKEK